MAQKDYVGRVRTSKKPRKTSSPKKNKKQPKKNSSVSSLTLSMTFCLLVVFLGSLYYLKTNSPQQNHYSTKKGTTEQSVKPVPGERYRYTRVLKDPQTVLPIITEKSNNINSNNTLSEEQRNLLELLQKDRPAQENSELPSTYNPQVNAIQNRDSSTISTAASTAATNTPSEQTNNPTNTNIEKAKTAWLLQCGSFRAIKQAESLKNKIIDNNHPSYIEKNNAQLYRVMVGPYNSYDKAQQARPELALVGIDCIPISPRT